MMTRQRGTPLEDDWIPTQHCSVDLRLRILRNLPFFEQISDADLSRINQHYVERGYEAGRTIYRAGLPGTRLYIVADGFVNIIRHTEKGKGVMLDILGQGEFFGSIASLKEDTYQETAQTQTPVCTLSISRSAFRKILEKHPSAALNVMDLMASRLVEAQEMVQQLSVYTVKQRIAYVLRRLAKKAGEDHELGRLIRFPLSRDDLASLTGTTPETASRVMSAFQKKGLVRSGRQWIAIEDEQGLASIG